MLLLDVAHADSGVVARAVDELRARLPRVPLVVGNVATAAAARFLVEPAGPTRSRSGSGPGAAAARGSRRARACRSCRPCARSFSRPAARCR